jgi:D-xylose 1-dehydrogenase (NADP+, D-xylono-1,5-lactone-forming)
LSIDPLQVAAAFASAEANHLLLGEALMYRFHPQTSLIQKVIDDGLIGELALIRATHSFVMKNPELDFRSSKVMEGGALMDLGCYCVSTARLLAGEPEWVQGSSILMASGVDMRFAGIMRFPRSVVATLDCAMDLPDRGALEIVGTAGEILVSDPWRCTAPSFVLRNSVGERHVQVPIVNRYRAEFDDFSTAIMQGSPIAYGRDDAVAQASAMALLARSAEQGLALSFGSATT